MARTASDVLAVVLLQRECGIKETLRVVGTSESSMPLACGGLQQLGLGFSANTPLDEAVSQSFSFLCTPVRGSSVAEWWGLVLCEVR
jgi:hypothetical protein